MEYERHFFRRSNLLLIAYAVCLAFFVCVLYDAQIVHGADYLSESATQVTTTQKVKTFRGSITDRNGKVLVSNRQIYTVTFDPKLVEDDPAIVPGENSTVHSESVAQAMLRLLRLRERLPRQARRIAPPDGTDLAGCARGPFPAPPCPVLPSLRRSGLPRRMSRQRHQQSRRRHGNSERGSLPRLSGLRGGLPLCRAPFP